MRLAFCVACGLDDPAALEHHHLVPRSQGGSDDETNLVTYCGVCHGKAHAMRRPNNIRALTKVGLATAKERGVKLGGYSRQAQLAGAASNKIAADKFAANVIPIIRQAQAAGASSFRAIADVLNARGVRPAGNAEVSSKPTAFSAGLPFETRELHHHDRFPGRRTTLLPQSTLPIEAAGAGRQSARGILRPGLLQQFLSAPLPRVRAAYRTAQARQATALQKSPMPQRIGTRSKPRPVPWHHHPAN